MAAQWGVTVAFLLARNWTPKRTFIVDTDDPAVAVNRAIKDGRKALVPPRKKITEVYVGNVRRVEPVKEENES